MRTLFQEDLQKLGDELIRISTLAAEAMDKARRAFEDADVQLADEVIAADQRIDALQNDLDEHAIDLLALQGPVASDLRMIVGALRMSASLERMGDLARHIAQLVRLRFPDHVAPDHLKPVFSRMAEHSVTGGRKVTELLETRDLVVAREVTEINEQINELHRSIFTLIAEEDWEASAATTADCTLASRYFERFGDHAVAVSNKVAYLVTGEWDAKAAE